MSLVSSNVPNFVNGISQQPYPLRLNTQGSFQENGYSTVYTGLRKRMPTEHIAKLTSVPLADAFIHTINRDDVEQYQVIITNGNLQVYDLAGNAHTVAFTDQAYLNCAGTVASSFGVVTVADYTFITNKTKKTAAGTTTQPTRPHEAIISVKSGNYGKLYTITVNNATRVTCLIPDGTSASGQTVVNVQTPTGGNDSSGNPIWSTTYTHTYTWVGTATEAGTDTIAGHLYDTLAYAGFGVGSWVLKVKGSLIYLKNTLADFTLSCEDGFGNNAMVVIKDNLQKFSDLPAVINIDGFTIQIVGTDTSAFDNYWVRYDAKGADSNEGVWRECVAPGTILGLDATTMPHQLIRNADFTFTFGPCAWKDRVCGDIVSNPNPSLVGRTINDVFFFQNRLGFLADENFVQTETGKFFNVFRTTVTTLLDSDPVDVNAATNKVAILQHAVAFNKQLILFSKMQQFVVDSTVLMSPKKVPIRPTTDFVTNTFAKPVAAGRNLYFAADKGSWSMLQEFYAETISTVNDASDITAHVPQYVPSNLVKIAASPTESVLVMMSATDRTKLFVYKYFFSGTEKLQSSWSHFTVGGAATILNFEFIKSILYLVVSRSSGVYLEKMDFSIGATDTGEPYHVLLDRKVQIPSSALTFATGVTTIPNASIGYVPNDGATYNAVALGGGSVIAGTILACTWNGVSMTVSGDQTASGLAFGQVYTMTYIMSPLMIAMMQRNGQKQTQNDGRTQVRKVTFNHAKTGFYNVLVTPIGRQTYTYTFSGAYLGTGSAILGTQPLDDGRFQAAVMCKNTDATIMVQSTAPMPVNLLGADWEAFYVDRSQNL